MKRPETFVSARSEIKASEDVRVKNLRSDSADADVLGRRITTTVITYNYTDPYGNRTPHRINIRERHSS